MMRNKAQVPSTTLPYHGQPATVSIRALNQCDIRTILPPSLRFGLYGPVKTPGKG